jgi:hypothetical protein
VEKEIDNFTARILLGIVIDLLSIADREDDFTATRFGLNQSVRLSVRQQETITEEDGTLENLDIPEPSLSSQVDAVNQGLLFL